MASDKASLKEPLLRKWDEEEDGQAGKRVVKKAASRKKKADEQEVGDLEQGVVEDEEEVEKAKPAKKKVVEEEEVEKAKPAKKKVEDEEEVEKAKPAKKKVKDEDEVEKAKPAKKKVVEEEEEKAKQPQKKAAKEDAPEEAEEEAEPSEEPAAKKAAAAEVEEEKPEAKEDAEEEETPEKDGKKVKLSPKQEFKAVGDVALLAPKLEHMKSLPWSEKNERVLEKWKKDVTQKIKECDAHAKGQANLGRMLVIPATILGAMTTASSGLSALVKNTPALSYAAAGMSLVLTILTALHTSLNPEKQVQAYLTAKDKYQSVKNKIEATLAIDIEQRGDTGAHFILEIQDLMDKADDGINGMEGGGAN